MLKRFKSILLDNYIYLCLVALLSSNVLIYHLANIYLEESIVGYLRMVLKALINYLAGMFIPVCILIALELLNINILVRVYRYTSIIAYYIIFIVDTFLYIKFDSFLDQAKLEILLSADPETSREFLDLYVLDSLLWIIVCIIATAWLLKKLMSYILCKRECLLKIFYVSALSFMLLGIRSYVNLGGNELFLSNFYRDSSVGRVIIDTYSTIKQIGEYSHVYDKLNNNNEYVIEDCGDVPYIVFVLGESEDRNKMSAYGYANKTTPFLDKRLRTGEAILFTDTIACANYTTRAMQLIFSFCEKDSSNPWYEYGNLLDIFNKCGYETIWISNQSPVGRYGNMDKIMSTVASKGKFTSISGGSNGDDNTRARDSEILPLLDDSLGNNEGERKFYVIHLEGVHEDYRLRYPNDFSAFTESDEEGTNLKWNKVKAEYDNAVLYNDYILDEIIKKFEHKNAVVVYISDHGSEVYDGRDFVGHSSEEYGNKHMIEIPMFIWGSNEYWQSHGEMKKNLYAAKDNPYCTENIIHLVLDIAKIKTSSYERDKSILSPDNIYFSKPRIYGNAEYVK